MKIAETVFGLERLPQLPHWLGRLAIQSARLLRIFGTTLAAIFVILYFLLNQISNPAVAIDLLTRNDILWPLLGFSAAVTLTGQMVTYFLKRPRSSSVTDSRPGDKPAIRHESVRPTTDFTHQVLHLTRSAERLDNVEKDLIRKISENYQVDLATHNLLREMRVCTNRLRGQLSYLAQLDQSPSSSGKIGDRDEAKVKAGFDPPDLGMARYETPQYRRR